MPRIATCLVLGLYGFTVPVSMWATPPNILLVLTDDLGWRDLGCYGSTFYETPSIDRLASQGLRFTDAYAAATVCSPTRAAILTGKTPARLHLTDFIRGLDCPYAALTPPDWPRYLAHEEFTLAEMLKQVGYETFHFGKWHLGREEHFPVTQGFDHSIAESAWEPSGYFYPWPNVKNMTGDEGDYFTDRLTDEVIQRLERSHDRPFFMYVAYSTPHRPTEAKEELTRKYAAKLTSEHVQRNPVNAGMIHSLDENVGRIMQSLDDLKLADKTLFIFTSDNGGNHYANRPQKTNNAPLRGNGTELGGIKAAFLKHGLNHCFHGTYKKFEDFSRNPLTSQPGFAMVSLRRWARTWIRSSRNSSPPLSSAAASPASRSPPSSRPSPASRR